MRRGQVVRVLGCLLVGVFLAAMVGRSSLFAGDGAPYVLVHDLREDPARDLIRSVRKAVQRFRGVAVTDALDSQPKPRRACDEDGGQTP